MRTYGIVSTKFWIEGTGKRLRGDSDAQLVALYAMSSPHTTATGVFHLPKLYISHEVGISIEGASKALQRLSNEAFCTYDDPSEVIFVHRLAAIQIAEQLKPNDKRITWLRKEVEKMPSGLLKQRFLDAYGEAFRLIQPLPLASPSEGSSKPRSRSGSRSIQDQDQDSGSVVSTPAFDATSIDAAADRIRKAIQTFPKDGDADIAKMVRVELHEVQQVRRSTAVEAAA